MKEMLTHPADPSACPGLRPAGWRGDSGAHQDAAFRRAWPGSQREAQRAIVLGQFIHSAIGFIVILLGQLSGVANALGWSIVGIYLLFVLGYGYFQFVKPSTS